MKGTKEFKNTIQTYLDNKAKQDPLFAKNLAKENKNIEDCITYIINTVAKKKASVLCDEEVYSMAIHYYDEDEIKVAKRQNCKVVSSKNGTKEPQRKISPKAKNNINDLQQLNLFE